MDKKRNKRNVWLSIGAAVLIILLILWLFFAMSAGDTDVNAETPEQMVEGLIVPLVL